MPETISSALVAGAGWTGRQIALQISAFGVPTFLSDTREAAVADALRWASRQADANVASGEWPAHRAEAVRTNLRAAGDADEVDLAIESVPEQASIKRRALQGLSRRHRPPAIIASNSSYFLPSQLSKYVESPERFAHLHFHVPVWQATLVDIVPGPSCDTETVTALERFAERIGQTPIVQTVENPGYVFNWMLQALLAAALDLIDRGVAEPAQIDAAWRTVTKMPIGPIGIIDRIGVDVVHQVLRNAQWAENDPRLDRLIAILQPLVDDGRLGWKTGQGFYEYGDKDGPP